MGGTESGFAGERPQALWLHMRPSSARRQPAELRIRRRFPHQVRNRAAVEESGIRPVGDGAAPGPKGVAYARFEFADSPLEEAVKSEPVSPEAKSLQAEKTKRKFP
jgi:hypothetical protein